jgi:ECF sigma factor
MNDVTRILNAIEQGDSHASEELLPLVYDALRRLAAEKMAQETPGQTLQATALARIIHDPRPFVLSATQRCRFGVGGRSGDEGPPFPQGSLVLGGDECRG